MCDQDDNKETLTNSCKFKLSKKRDCTPVFVTEFTNGLMKSEGARELQFQCVKSSNDSRILSVTNGRLSYSGTSSKESEDQISYFVGVRNKNTGRMKLYDSRYFRMKPNILGSKTSNDLSTSIEDEGYIKKMEELNASFGIKAKKRAISSSHKNAVDSSTLDYTSLLVNNEFNPDESTTYKAPVQVSYLPPSNKDAAIVQEVFDINTIISPSEDSALDVKASELIGASNELIVQIKSEFCSYVINHFDLGEQDRIKTKYLIYYSYLVIFQNLKYNDIRRKDPTSKIPEPFKSCLLDNFTVPVIRVSGNKGKMRTCPPLYKDKLLAYILVLALFIDDFNVNLHAVANDLSNVKLNKLVTLAATLGCHISTITTNGELLKYAVLKLPLYVKSTKPSKHK